MSRSRKPTKYLELVGAFKKDPKRKAAREGEPEVESPLGDPPPHFNAARKELWVEVSGMAPWLCVADRYPVERLSVLMVKWRDGDASEGEQKMIDQLCVRLGLTPADRSKIKVPGEKKKPANAFGELTA